MILTLNPLVTHAPYTLLDLVLQLCKTQYKINWITVQSVVKFLQQVDAICLQYSHNDIIG